MFADEDLFRHAVENFDRADALLFGRVTYELMEGAWRSPAPTMPDWTKPFARKIDAAKTYLDIQRWTVMKKGGHFAALEQPRELASEISAFFDERS